MTTPPDRDPTSAYEPPSTAEPARYEPPATADPSPYATAADATAAPDPAGPPPGWIAPDAAPATASDPAGFATPDAGPVAHLPGLPDPGPVAQIPGVPGPVAPPYPPPGYPVPSGYPVPPPYGAHVPYGAGYVHQPRMSDENGLAVGALVCSVIGVFTCLLSVPGIVMGHIALSKSNRGESGGRGLALAALAVGYAVVALWVAFFTTLIVLGANGYLDN